MSKILVIALTLGAVALAIYLSGHAQEQRDSDVHLERLDFPFEVLSVEKYKPLRTVTWKLRLFVAPDYYSKQNLDRLFRACSRSYPDKQEEIDVAVYTDKEKFKAERRNAGGVIVFADKPPKEDSPEGPLAYDAGFCRVGRNEWYWYRPDLRSATTRRVILKGLLPAPPQWRELEKVEVSNGEVKIRVTVGEGDVDPPGSYFEFESACNCILNWKPIMVFRHQNRVPIPRNQIRLANSQVAYLFMGWMYAVSTDQGKEWSVWDAEDDLPDWQCCDYDLIRDVKLGPDGGGIMTLNSISVRRGVTKLHTTDYGRHWSSQ